MSLNPITTILGKAIIPLKFCIKKIKYWIDNNFREKVVPIPGSVLYAELYVAFEHSGIYIGDERISNIVVDGFAESYVQNSDPDEFTEKSVFAKSIYVSSNKYGPVGDGDVCKGAIDHLGKRAFYGLLYSNCHTFSTKCVNYSNQSHSTFFALGDIDETWEPTISKLKKTAKRKIGATKWKLWDREAQQGNTTSRPDLNQIQDFYNNLKLNPEAIKAINQQLETAQDYLEEVNDENLPQHAIQYLHKFRDNLNDIKKEYSKAKEFMIAVGHDFSINELRKMNDDFLALAKVIENNQKIKEVVKKLGRDYISEYQKSQPKLDRRLNQETFGIHRSNDLLRILPSELLNLDDEDLEYLFYSKLLESNLLTYELIGYTTEEKNYKKKSKKGPVVACLDTSGSMEGRPKLLAKALLYSISKILDEENRSLHVLLFGSYNQIKELCITEKGGLSKLINFLNQGYNGGTDFETPLRRAVEIIEMEKDFEKADVLMISDGLCSLTNSFADYLKDERKRLDFSIYTILCAGSVKKDKFSDEVIKI